MTFGIDYDSLTVSKVRRIQESVPACDLVFDGDHHTVWFEGEDKEVAYALALIAGGKVKL
jgi:hypothetical protein